MHLTSKTDGAICIRVRLCVLCQRKAGTTSTGVLCKTHKLNDLTPIIEAIQWDHNENLGFKV